MRSRRSPSRFVPFGRGQLGGDYTAGILAFIINFDLFLFSFAADAFAVEIDIICGIGSVRVPVTLDDCICFSTGRCFFFFDMLL